jgi:hypothetical protein
MSGGGAWVQTSLCAMRVGSGVHAVGISPYGGPFTYFHSFPDRCSFILIESLGIVKHNWRNHMLMQIRQ